jgi:hypothetical protein
MRNVSDKICRENQNTRFVFSNFCYRAVYEVMWKNVEPDRSKMTIWRMRISCWLPKATDTQSEYGIHISFALQQWLHERPSLLRYTNIARLVLTNITSCEGKCNQSINGPIKIFNVPHHSGRFETLSIEQSLYLFVYLFNLKPFSVTQNW